MSTLTTVPTLPTTTSRPPLEGFALVEAASLQEVDLAIHKMMESTTSKSQRDQRQVSSDEFIRGRWRERDGEALSLRHTPNNINVIWRMLTQTAVAVADGNEWKRMEMESS
ncbi:GL24988 [Drosophila persimilis]|uniref:GL24988 n=1 Tax=Drosophila persimilis TaxID=7234 RepID=B4GRA2_DROPE|nr:GL24988 [Drosophila persimilis]